MLRHNGEQHPGLFPTDEPAADIARRRFTLLRDAYLRSVPPTRPPTCWTDSADAEGHTRLGAPLADALDLYEKSGPESVWCLPGEEYEQGAGLVWGTT